MDDTLLTDRELDELSYHLDHLVRPGSGALGTLAGTSVRYLSGILGAEGVPCEVVEAEGGLPCLVARLSAHRPDEGLLIVASGDPLGEGSVTPRKALQGSAMAAVGLMALALVHRREYVPTRDLVMAVVPGRGPDGVPPLRNLAALHRGRLRSRLVLTSDGIAPRTPGGRTLVGVQVASKGFARVRVRTVSESAASGPDSAPMRLVRSLLAIESGVLATRPCNPATKWLDTVVSTLPSRPAALLRGIQFLGAGAALSRLVHDRDLADTLASISHDTAEIVGLRAGEASGLPAGQAEADVILRVLPGRRTDECVRDLADRLGSEVSIEALDAIEPLEMPHPSPLWDRIAESVGRALPGALPLPTLSIDAWDAAALAPMETTAYGFGPLSVLGDDELSAPGGEPGLSRDGLQRAAEAFLRVALGICIPDRFPVEHPTSR